MSPSTATLLSSGKRPLSIFMSDDLPELGWPSTSVMVPGSNTPLKLRRMVLCTTYFWAESLSAAFLMVCVSVGSSRPSSWRPTTTAAETLRPLTRTSI
ncbi:hypothetical protein PF010_g31981 [Phytophthora fragariae]|uniref:Uncharacterized protein n=1 Tax=Phytophthora fragariae TaxID=53985 RepID=A0A6A3PSX5_9STRA|nr:hypothetical protein PF009_g32341 [Phytophthora fragariae]KAE9055878.1 hypothetical protein PF010_g31981 [Phytophthora fragariae]KAE9056686.1 hypothetical protein PF007_g31909 [Phytophthora fragariae]KAE9058004.1 hypothetical protein PF006_g32273 [Phytophthora fragariae]KAE9261961.1 hypothetical protein PF001_g32222 [Phytophthora fragariae]